jgi:endonuclease YncB( thermonuclease family)
MSKYQKIKDFAIKLTCGLLVSLVFALVDAKAEVLIGTVVGISDGDTITVVDADKTKHKIRLMGIDAPEKSQDFGAASKQALSNYIYQREVTVDYKKLDKYKRKVGKVILDKQDICLAMISDGMAWHYKDYEKEQSKTDRDLYSQAELKARESRIGLWQDSNAIEPSAFRHK